MGTELYKSLSTQPPRYVDRKYPHGPDAYFRALDSSRTLYVGNLSFYTTEEQIYELFSTVGNVKVIIMGLDRDRKTPCGFCFVEFYDRSAAEACMKYLNGTMLDERLIRTDYDPGFTAERQYGRGASGGQVRDEYRPDYDSGRGGYGRHFQQRDAPQAYTEFQSAAATTSSAAQSGGKRTRDTTADNHSMSQLPPPVSNNQYQQQQQQQQYANQPPPPPNNNSNGGGHDDDDAVEQRAKNPRFREADDEEEEN